MMKLQKLQEGFIMKNFKKIVAVMAAAMMTVCCLAGCGSDAPSGETAETPAQEAGEIGRAHV